MNDTWVCLCVSECVTLLASPHHSQNSHTLTGTHTHTRTHTHEPLVVTAFIDMAFMWVSLVNAATARWQAINCQQPRSTPPSAHSTLKWMHLKMDSRRSASSCMQTWQQQSRWQTQTQSQIQIQIQNQKHSQSERQSRWRRGKAMLRYVYAA